MEIDLRSEPTVVSVPAVPKPRYYSVQLTDANTFNYGYIGSRSTGTGAGDYMIVGPDWKGEPPSHIKQVFHSSTPFSVVIFRTQLFNAADMPNVVKVQAGYKVQPLSAYLKQPAPPTPLQSISARPMRSWRRRSFSTCLIMRCSIFRLARKRRGFVRSWRVSASVPASRSI